MDWVQLGILIAVQVIATTIIVLHNELRFRYLDRLFNDMATMVGEFFDYRRDQE